MFQHHRAHILICTLAIFLWIPLTLCAQNSTQKWITHTTQSGLPNSSVNCIFEDSYGLLWLGTWDGLCRYDGRNKTVYRHVSDDKSSLSHQVVRHICEDRNHHLWVTTDMGINRLNMSTGEFCSFFLDYGYDYVLRENSFFCDSSPDGKVVGACRGGLLYIYNNESDTFVKAKTANDIPGTFSNLFFDRQSVLWMVSGDFLLKIVEKKGAFHIALRIPLPEDGEKQVFFDGNNHIWCCAKGTLWKISTTMPHPVPVSTNISVTGRLTSVHTSQQKSTIITTTSGAYRIQGKTAQSILPLHISVLSVLQGSQDILWLGTDGRGLMQSFRQQEFITQDAAQELTADAYFPIRALLYDNGRLFAGSKGGGLIMAQKPVNGQSAATRTRITAPSSVLSMAKWHNGILVGTDEAGLQHLEPSALATIPLLLPDGSSSTHFGPVYAISIDGDDAIYIGTSGNGLYRLRTDANGKITSVANFRHSTTNDNTISSDIIYSLQQDKRYLWIGTRGGGLCRMDKRTEVFITYKHIAPSPKESPKNARSICCNDIISLLLDSDGSLWIGTTEGVSVMRGGAFTTINIKNGLPNDNIHSIVQDVSGRIWLSTSRGLACIDRHTLHVTPYTALPSSTAGKPSEGDNHDNEFADGAGFASATGEVFFGGSNGIHIVHPTSHVTTAFMPRLILTGIDWPKRSIGIIPACTKAQRHEIRCKYDEMPFLLHFSILDFKDNEKCQFQYFLSQNELKPSAFDNRWISLSDSRTLSLGNLSAGTYYLYARCSNSTNEWSQPLTYIIHVAPPWWNSWWAWIIYIASAAYGIVAFYRFKRRRLISEHRYELERQRQLNKEVTHEAKLRFFTNIAHEYSKSINLIYNAVDQIIAMGHQNAREQRQLMTIHRNAERMHKQIQDLMDFRKAETGHLELNISSFIVADLIFATADNFLDAAEHRGIELQVFVKPGIGPWTTDRGNLEKIVFNLLSSAIAHVPDNGHVELRAEKVDELLVVTCSNTGAGIPPEKIADVFNRITVLENFEQQMSQGIRSMGGIGMALCYDIAQLMSGSLTVESTPDVLTTFTLTLPMLQEETPLDTTEQSDQHVVSDEDREFMARAVEVVARHYSDEDFNKDVWASELALSRMQLYRRLHSILHIPPSTFIRSYRMKQAANLLTSTNKNVQEIAYACGYRNRSNFHRAFMQEYGCSPLDYRSKNAPTHSTT